RLRTVGYGNWESAIIESLVNAAVIRYLLEHESDFEIANQLRMSRVNGGFIWLDQLVAIFGAYENNREAYPNFSSLLTTLLEGYFSDLSKRIDFEVQKFEKIAPIVVSIFPLTDTTVSINPNTTHLKITFDKILDDKLKFSVRAGSLGKDHNPVTKVLGLSENGTVLTLEVELKPNRDYEFMLPGRRYKTKNGYQMKDYTVVFKTGNL
ncbi:MAG: DUF4932 domain-containing protein, partial [Cyclobacteriaceae bacterium]